MAIITEKIPAIPHNLEGDDLARSEDRDYKTPGFLPMEIYHVDLIAIGGGDSIQTGFNRVLGGWVYGFIATGGGEGSVTINADDPTQADLFLPNSVAGGKHIALIWGEKNPEKLV